MNTRTALLTGAAVAVAVAVPAATAQAADCVVTVTANTTLSADAPACTYQVAPGVTLDLGNRLVGAVAFGTQPGTANATVRNGRVDPAGLPTPPLAAILSNGPSFTVSQVTVVRGNLAGHLDGTSSITQNNLRAGKIALDGGTHTVAGNVVEGGGVELTNASGTIIGNVLQGNNGAGVGMTVTGNIQIINNNVSGHFIGIAGRIGPFSSLVVRGNSVTNNVSTGVLFEHLVGTALVENNLVANNGFGVSPGSGGAGDGIYVDVSPASGTTPPVTLRSNRATGNRWIGIEAVAGFVDGGGNKASVNQGPAQCVGVVCTAA